MSHRTPLCGAAAALVAASLFVSPSAEPAPGPQDPGSPPSGLRGVRFAIDPPGAQLAIDGRVLPWFGRTIPLTVGAHSVSAEVPASRCCEPFAGTISVAPQRGGAAQTIALRLKPRPAQVVLVDAPQGAMLLCPAVGLAAAAGRLVDVPMARVQWSGRCELAGPGREPRTKAVALTAGEVNAVRW